MRHVRQQDHQAGTDLSDLRRRHGGGRSGDGVQDLLDENDSQIETLSDLRRLVESGRRADGLQDLLEANDSQGSILSILRRRRQGRGFDRGRLHHVRLEASSRRHRLLQLFRRRYDIADRVQAMLEQQVSSVLHLSDLRRREGGGSSDRLPDVLERHDCAKRPALSAEAGPVRERVERRRCAAGLRVRRLWRGSDEDGGGD